MNNIQPTFSEVPTPTEIREMLHYMHGVLVDHHDDIMLWLPVSLEDMADLLTRSMTITGTK
tara:strand:+ start:59 stop:241 length:183 start_codon:yes stop_codon:yes gene_type:complete